MRQPKIWAALALGFALITPSTAEGPVTIDNDGIARSGSTISTTPPDATTPDASSRHLALVLSSLGMLAVVALHRLARMDLGRPSA